MTPSEHLNEALRMTNMAMSKPTPEQEKAEQAEKAARKRWMLDRPPVWQVDEQGEMQCVGTDGRWDGYVLIEDYYKLHLHCEEVEARLRELVEQGRKDVEEMGL